MHLLPTSLVGSYPQPEWLINREMLAKQMPPRVRVEELWRVNSQWLDQAQDDATLLAIRDQERAGWIFSRTVRCAGKVIRTASRLRSPASTWITREQFSAAAATRFQFPESWAG